MLAPTNWLCEQGSSSAFQVVSSSFTSVVGCHYPTSPFHFKQRMCPPKQRHTCQHETMLVKENLEASSPLCLGPHAFFVLPCSEFWEYRSSQLCLTAGHGEGSFHNPLALFWVQWPPVSVPLHISDITFPSELLFHV